MTTRTAQAQTNHNKMVKFIAESLNRLGYDVLADDIGWYKGAPSAIGGFVPDITANKDSSHFIFEIETCSSYSSDHTRSQLAAFNKANGTTYVVIPHSCTRDGMHFNPVPEMRDLLNGWGLSSVKIGTCNPHNGNIVYDPDKKN